MESDTHLLYVTKLSGRSRDFYFLVWIHLSGMCSFVSGNNSWSSFDVHACHDVVIKWKHFQHYWPFARGIIRSPVNSPHKGQWRRALIFSLICSWISSWVNNREAGNLRRHRAHYDVIMCSIQDLLAVQASGQSCCICGWTTDGPRVILQRNSGVCGYAPIDTCRVGMKNDAWCKSDPGKAIYNIESLGWPAITNSQHGGRRSRYGIYSLFMQILNSYGSECQPQFIPAGYIQHTIWS